MDIPALTPREYFIAAQLVNHGAMRPTAIATAAGRMITRGGLAKILFMMERRGLIKKVPHRDARRQTLIILTTHGREAWAEFLDWTTCIAQGTEFSPVPAPDDRPAAGRDPTADERRRLLQHASANFGEMLRGVWELPDVSIADLAAADVEDWNLHAGELAVGRGGRRRLVPLSEEAKAVVIEAIGFRTAGPIFVPVRAERYNRELVQHEFRDLRGRAGILPEVKLRRRRATAVTRGSQGLKLKEANAMTRTSR